MKPRKYIYKVDGLCRGFLYEAFDELDAIKQYKDAHAADRISGVNLVGSLNKTPTNPTYIMEDGVDFSEVAGDLELLESRDPKEEDPNYRKTVDIKDDNPIIIDVTKCDLIPKSDVATVDCECGRVDLRFKRVGLWSEGDKDFAEYEVEINS